MGGGRGRCRLHGGKSTGARTAEGRQRARTARLVHGRRTAGVIGLRSAAAAVSRRLAWMTELARACAPERASIPDPTHARRRELSAGHGVHRSDSTPPLGGSARRRLAHLRLDPGMSLLHLNDRR